MSSLTYQRTYEVKAECQWLGQIKGKACVLQADVIRVFYVFSKTELTWDEWYEFLTDLCLLRHLDQEQIELNMTNCGIPGTSAVFVPQYRDFFDTYKPKEKMMF